MTTKFIPGKDIWVCEIYAGNEKWLPLPHYGSHSLYEFLAKDALLRNAHLFGDNVKLPDGNLNMKLFRFRKYRKVTK